MNRQWVSVLSVLALVVLVAPTSGLALSTEPATPAASTAPVANESNNSSLGTSISSFMQVSSVEASGEVDRGMFSAALANAPNESARERLIERRASRLSNRLDSVKHSVDTAEKQGGPERAVANARVDALERSVADVDTHATRTGVSPPGLTQLRENVRQLREPAVPPVIETGVGGDVSLDPPAGNENSGEGAGVGNSAGGQQGDDGNAAPGSGSNNGQSGSAGGDGPSDDVGAPSSGGVNANGDGAVTGPGLGSSNTTTTGSVASPVDLRDDASLDTATGQSNPVTVLAVYD